MLKTERDGRSAKQNESEAVALAEHDQPVQPELSILMPCLNEARTLAVCIKKAQLFLKLQGVSEDALEMVIKANMRGLRITEVPTTLSPDGRDRAPHLRRYRDGWRSLRFYLLMSPRWFFGVPGLILLVGGWLGFRSATYWSSNADVGHV
jgi:hypothetical protein